MSFIQLKSQNMANKGGINLNSKKTISAIGLIMMFLISTWCNIAPLNTDSGVKNEYYVEKEHLTWESVWIASEPSVLSSEFGGGLSITMKWLESQSQIYDCEGICPTINETANEWMNREKLPLLLIFNRPGPTIETQEELQKFGIKLDNNPWRDSIDTPLIDESKLVGSFDQTFVENYTLDIGNAEDADFDINELNYSPPLDWSLGAWGSWVLASMGSEIDTLHAPLRGNQDYWRIGDVWFASATPENVTNLVSNNLWNEISKAIPSLVKIDLDLKLGTHTPLDEDRKWTGTDTQLDVGIPPAWNHSVYNTPLRGDNIRIADFDTGIEVFHPAFFNPSNNITNWVDNNNNSEFDWGIDGIDYDGNGQLSVNETLLRLANGDGVDDITRDTYYLDLDEDGEHDHGTSSVYDDSSPGFGEPMYQVKDQNSDGVLSTNEYFMQLDKSTILATYDPNSGERVRGVDLIHTAPDTNGHGTSVQGIIAANNESHYFSGIAPNADLLSFDAFAGGWANAQSWGTQRNADIMLYEVGSWTAHFLDGTDAVELNLDQMANAGVVQINPAGNLGGSDKLIQGQLPDVDDSLGPLTTTFTVYSNQQPTTAYLTYLIPNGNDISLIEITKPGGSSVDISNSSGWVHLSNGDWVYVTKDTSIRNTNLVMLTIANNNGLELGSWDVDIAGPSGQGRVLFRGYENDAAGSWGGGCPWDDPSPSSLATITDNGSVTWPATADSAITVASWSPRGWGVSEGELSSFSSRGTRINDGMPLLDIASAGNHDIRSPRSSQSGGSFGSYTWFGGTSAAGPGVAAIAGLMLQDNPGVGHHEIWNMLNATAYWNSTTGELWNYSSRLAGNVGNPTDVVGATMLSNGTWVLSQPHGTPIGGGIRIGDPMPGTPAPDTDWGWGYIRADRATDRDTISPDISYQSNVSYELLEPTNIPLNVNDNSIGDGNPLTMNVTCIENQNGNDVVIDYQENLPIGDINCTFNSTGTNEISLEVTDYANNKQYSTISISTIFGEPAQLVTSSPHTHIVTTDELIQLEARVRNSWGAERPLEPQEWFDGIPSVNEFIIESANTGYVIINPIKTGLYNLSVNLYNSSIWFDIVVSRGANHHADFKIIPPSSGLTDVQGIPIYTPDEAIRFQIKWFDQDNNSGNWENYSGNDVGYIEIYDNLTQSYISAQDAESNDSSIGLWNDNEFNPLRSGEINIWIGKENSNGELIIGNFSVNVEPGIPQELYLLNLDNNTVELKAGETWSAELYGHDIANNTVEIETSQWELYQSTNELELAKSGFTQIYSNTSNHTILKQNVSGEHLLFVSHTRNDGHQLTLNLMMNISPEMPDKLTVNPSNIEITAGEYFDINATLYDKYDNILDNGLLNVTYTNGVCNCVSSLGNWQITTSGTEYIYLEYGDINRTIEITVSPTYISQIKVGMDGNESLELHEYGTLNFTATDIYDNSAEINLSSIIFSEIGEGLIMNGMRVYTISGGQHSIQGHLINEMGENIEFVFSIEVTGDRDYDGVGDDSDNCNNTFNPEQADIDDDNIGDICDSCNDIDGDGICDEDDAFPNDPTEDKDSDNDGIGDNSEFISVHHTRIIIGIIVITLLIMAVVDEK